MMGSVEYTGLGSPPSTPRIPWGMILPIRATGRLSTAVAALVASLLLAACASSFAEISTGGSYTLRTINLEELPILERVGSCTLTVESGRLLLYTDDTFELDFETHAEPSTCAGAGSYPRKTVGTYTSTGFSVKMSPPTGRRSTAA